MNLHEIINKFQKSTGVVEIVDLIKNHLHPKISLKNVCGSADALIGSVVASQTGVSQLFVLNDKEEAAYFFNNIENFHGKNKAYYFPATATSGYVAKRKDSSTLLHRSEVLNAITTRKKGLIIVTYPEALSEKVVSEQTLRKTTLEIHKNEELSIEFIMEVFIEYGFNHVDFVSEPGEFSVRGGIVDVYSFSNDFPFRIEFFGNKIESLRTFDPASQLSSSMMERISVIPDIQNQAVAQSRESFFQFIRDNTIVWIKDVELCEGIIQKVYEKKQLLSEKENEEGKLELLVSELLINSNEFISALNRFSLIEFGTRNYFQTTYEIKFHQKIQPPFRKNFDRLFNVFKERKSSGYEILVAASNTRQIKRLYDIWEDTRTNEELCFATELINIHEGFEDEELQVCLFTDHQIFERYHRFHLKEGYSSSQQAITLKELMMLNKGDFVTHIDHGVGVFDGLEKIEVKEKKQEAIRLRYKDGDILYVSIHSLHRISRYSGKDGAEPNLNKLGSKAWENLKNKTKKKVKEIAFDLIKLYAKRKATIGHSFPPDNYLQHELEASFLFEDTPDQEKATIDVKQDMESQNPMDRLICGDVGFGKTEIAIRAAFKAVCDGKQVAVLAPTTILTLQHFKTFSSRLAEFPVTVDYINRFKSTKDQGETLKKLQEGKVDIIIGTHRIVGKDVKFKDLGLLIIDEEQKFGVSHKDKLKLIKAHVDTLTLTATPIPRTLQFSMFGARDLSIINTPPPNRQSVQTELHGLNEALIKEAIYYEVGRGGQVFFVHNRVKNIEEVRALINRLCPDVKVAIGHGQMEGRALEKVMLDFIEGDFDVLLATTIIESGLDIPNANTIIINHAHMFGLSDLHQMRGRVGRSNRKAFCYLLAPPLTTLTAEARKRLKAIEQFAELGSGFNISMRDLDIRGAGNLLGAEQSGFITEMGMETYKKILDEAIMELKNNEFKTLFSTKTKAEGEFVNDTIVDMDLDAMIPDQYVSSTPERLVLYKNLSEIENEEGLRKFAGDLEDRFGELPNPVVDLLESVRLKWICRKIGFERLTLKNGLMRGYFPSNSENPFFQSEWFGQIINYVKENPEKCALKEKNNKLTLLFKKVSKVTTALESLKDLQTINLKQIDL